MAETHVEGWADRCWLGWTDPAARAAASRWLQPGDRVWVTAVEAASTLAWVVAGQRKGAQVILAAPDWTPAWAATGRRVVDPTLEVAADGNVTRLAPPACTDGAGTVVLATGGTGGRLGWVELTAAALVAAATGYGAWWGEPVRALGVLPVWHVSGLLPPLRAAVTGGDFAATDYRQLGRPDGPDPAGWTVSLVPTQLARLLEEASSRRWLAATRLVLVGGAATDPALRARAGAAGVPLALSYGMTETAAAVAVWRPSHPEETVADQPIAATLLPHVRATVVEPWTSLVQGPENSGQIVLSGPSAAVRTWREQTGWQAVEAATDGPGRRWVTGDRGWLTADGRLVVTGRLDAFINTGGEKVDPEWVRQIILGTGLVRDAWVAGRPDADWGEQVVAWMVPATKEVTATQLAEVLRPLLPPAARPKRWQVVAEIPRTAAGKVDGARLK